MIELSDRLTHVHSDIRGPLYVEALRMQAAGTPVLKLNTGNPGNFGFTLPESVRQALLEHVDEAVPYCDVRGMAAAREAILAYHQSRGLQGVTMDDIFICNGVSESVSMLMTALVGTGDEVLVPSPCYSLWSNNTYLGGGKPVHYRCDPNNDWNPDLEDIRSKITPRTKAILVINPNNPTGAVYSKQTLLDIAQMARENHLLLLADEIYDRLVLEDLPTYSIAALAPDLPCVTFNGLSKSHIICGFRCGWMVFSGPEEELTAIKHGVMQLAAMRLCGNTLTQLVIPAALSDRESTRAMMAPGGRLYEQSKATVEGLRKIPGVTQVPNRAAFYLFPGLENGAFDFESDEDFAMKFLHEKHILVIPGHGFDWFEDLRFRIVMLPEPERITQAMAQLGEFLDEHRR
ncbi:MAG: aminotransferase class I/II-fold pyridoxal phosphate-dependent enzyme [Candidatus Faecousia sp.]|nr:aminotransferase class I/II-fold pyridoxal phosphate-dependent enzyme [Oscillospiraceae bacterium]MDY2557380.1 aminotransferase class I/II-fold pyridoxal phosphate-dependent enzyme [Candidatus Faecousia sp.]